MTALTDVFALFGIAVALCAGTVYTLHAMWSVGTTQPLWLKGRKKAWVLMLFIVMLVPIPGTGISFAGYVRGFIGDLSITLMALSILGLCHRLLGTAALGQRELSCLLFSIGTAALILYPTALGWGNWDAYRLGWGSWWVLLDLLLLSGVFAWLGLRLLPAVVALALLAWSFGLMESNNLWDYLLDPWLAAFALGFIFINCGRAALRQFVNRSLP